MKLLYFFCGVQKIIVNGLMLLTQVKVYNYIYYSICGDMIYGSSLSWKYF